MATFTIQLTIILNTILVTKEDGKKEEFSLKKFQQSLSKSKATPEQIEEVVQKIKEHLVPGIRTRDIYKMASKMLKKQSPAHSARFCLKKAIMQLGPTGYPFERFVGALFSAKGYSTNVGVILQGACVTHEVDVVAFKGIELVLVECKYHNQSGMNVDVKVPLYINSRFQDLLDNHILKSPNTQYNGWIATNSRFSDDALSYGSCKGLNLLSWNYPNGNSLKDWVDQSGLYPITCMQGLTGGEKRFLLEQGLVLVSELKNNRKVLKSSGVSDKRMDSILNEVHELTNV